MNSYSLDHVFDLIEEQGDERLFKQTVMLSDLVLRTLVETPHLNLYRNKQSLVSQFPTAKAMEHHLEQCLYGVYLGHPPPELPDTGGDIPLYHFLSDTPELYTHHTLIHQFLTEWYVSSTCVNDSELHRHHYQFLGIVFLYLTLTLGVLHEQRETA